MSNMKFEDFFYHFYFFILIEFLKNQQPVVNVENYLRNLKVQILNNQYNHFYFVLVIIKLIT